VPPEQAGPPPHWQAPVELLQVLPLLHIPPPWLQGGVALHALLTQ
jgi:hypothetical protein